MEKESSLDAIMCSTPDHTHAYVSLLALRADKHVYCEKPLTHNIWEARQVQKVARETGLATQMGNMGHSTNGMRQTVEYLQAGAIGTRKGSARLGPRHPLESRPGRPARRHLAEACWL